MKYIKYITDTIPMMESEDYKERFRAEYWQVYIRYQKLDSMLEQWDFGALEFLPVCPKWMFEKQLSIMWDYIEILRERAKQEGIDLFKNNSKTE